MKPFVIFLHGLSGSGKTTIGKKLYKDLSIKNKNLIYIDGDIFRKGVSSDLGYSLEDRAENIRRLMELCKVLLNSNINIIASFIAPTESIRNIMRNNIIELVEVWCDKPLTQCEQDDIKGLYKMGINNFTGKTQIFELPVKHDLILATNRTSVVDCVEIIKNYLFYLRPLKSY